MPRYYFDVHDERDFIDDEGIECHDLGAARREALKTAGGMVSEIAAWDGRLWSMNVRDERGAIVASLRFTAS